MIGVRRDTCSLVERPRFRGSSWFLPGVPVVALIERLHLLLGQSNLVCHYPSGQYNGGIQYARHELRTVWQNDRVGVQARLLR